MMCFIDGLDRLNFAFWMRQEQKVSLAHYWPKRIHSSSVCMAINQNGDLIEKCLSLISSTASAMMRVIVQFFRSFNGPLLCNSPENFVPQDRCMWSKTKKKDMNSGRDEISLKNR